MAWLALVIVVIYFFAPGLGEASRLIGQTLVAYIQLPLASVAFPIPGTGSLRLFFACTGTWLILWMLFYLPDRFLGERALRERKPYQDFLSSINLWDDFVVAFRPYVSINLAVWLAKLILIGFIVKLLLGYLMQFAMDTFLPELLGFLLAQFGSSFSSIQGVLQQFILDLTGFGVNSIGMILLVLSFLILIVNYAFGFEQRYRYQYAVQQQQNRTRKEQKDIAIPATQL